MHYERRILSRPHPVYWAGFRSDTVALQQAGWEFSASQRYEINEVGLMMRHQATGMHAQTSTVPAMMYDSMAHHENAPSFRVQWMTDKGMRMRTIDIQPWVAGCDPVDMRPQMIEVKSIEDMNLFAGCMARTHEVVVDPETVPDLMARILEMQEPGRQEHFRQMVADNRREDQMMRPSPRQQFHAQIISLVA